MHSMGIHCLHCLRDLSGIDLFLFLALVLVLALAIAIIFNNVWKRNGALIFFLYFIWDLKTMLLGVDIFI